MKKYKLTLNVPDDFSPEELDISLDYKDDISIDSEGFEIPEELIKKVSIDTESISQNSVVIFRYPSEIIADDPLFVQSVMKYLEDKTGATVVGLISDMSVLVSNSAEAVKMLEGMISKIKSKSIITLL